MGIMAFLSQPWPWYVVGPLIGLTVPALYLVGNKRFGISSSMRHVCAMLPSRIDFFRYDWRKEGGWNLVFTLGILIGGFLGGFVLRNDAPVELAVGTVAALERLGVPQDNALVPTAIFNWGNLFSLPGFLLMVVGGFLVGFGARYAGGCTSGHAISGLAELQWPSLVAVIGFFIGGLISAHILLPLILGL